MTFIDSILFWFLSLGAVDLERKGEMGDTSRPTAVVQVQAPQAQPETSYLISNPLKKQGNRCVEFTGSLSDVTRISNGY